MQQVTKTLSIVDEIETEKSAEISESNQSTGDPCDDPTQNSLTLNSSEERNESGYSTHKKIGGYSKTNILPQKWLDTINSAVR